MRENGLIVYTIINILLVINVAPNRCDPLWCIEPVRPHVVFTESVVVMTKRGLLWDSPALRLTGREIDMWSESWTESSVVNGHVLGSLRITQREVCELNMLYSCLEWIPGVDSDGNRFPVGTVLEWNSSVCKYICCLKWISLRVRELPVGQSV